MVLEGRFLCKIHEDQLIQEIITLIVIFVSKSKDFNSDLTSSFLDFKTSRFSTDINTLGFFVWLVF